MLLAAAPSAQALKIAPEKPGRWRFEHPERPIKAVALGGSVTAWPKAYTHFLMAACPRVEIVNRGKAGIGAPALKRRFEMQVLRNRRIDLTAHEEFWILSQGGLNSIGTPTLTNHAVRRLLMRAHKAGLKTLGLTLMPWGSKRWRGAKGIRGHLYTRLAVDYLLGKLTPREALGSYAGDRTDAWQPGELPDIVVDMYYESTLRDREAPLRDEAKIRRALKYDSWARRTLKSLPEEHRAEHLEQLVTLGRELHRWFIRKDLQAFDHIHPSTEGHQLMAQAVCPKAPASWGCECDLIPKMRWSKAVKGFTPRAELPAPK